MDGSALLLLSLNFACIGALPRVFFRSDGRLNVKWWLTAWPFFLCPALVVLAAVLGREPLAPVGWRTGLDLLAVVLDAASIALIFLTLGTHRVPLALWHQDDDAPRHLVTHGAYRRIRHPFYSAFLLAFLAALCVWPHWVTAAFAVYGFAALRSTAVREERRLAASEFGAQYRSYLARSGRFFPRLGRIPADGTPAAAAAVEH
ncbi:methyltransferase family protein [Streptomyces gamaensis]|uniref:Methyltransferase family protein n=1 Tax=Streptomyces gamaensis TaxID=1763542 RepID=A0ABW0ZD12_9ACTN